MTLSKGCFGILIVLIASNDCTAVQSSDSTLKTEVLELTTRVKYLEKTLTKVLTNLLNTEKCKDGSEDEDDVDYGTLLGKLPIETLSGLRGYPGREGRDGRDGDDGRDGIGIPGRDGLAGKDGTPGSTGAPGQKGESGDRGAAGVAGQRGLAGLRGQRGPPGAAAEKTGAVYTRWGRTTCGSRSSLVYKGFAGRSEFRNSGGGVNTQCMPPKPEYNRFQTRGTFLGSWMAGVEYQISDNIGVFPGNPQNQNVPCARCYTRKRSAVMMIPAKRTCPDGWTNEYEGYLMTEKYNHPHPADYECVDANPEFITGQHADTNGGLFYFVRPQCPQAAHCPPYEAAKEFTCVVCTR